MEIIFINKSPEIYYDFPLRSHECWELILNLYGSGTAVIDGQNYPFREGTIFCVPPGAWHCKKAENGFMDGCIFIRDFLPVDHRRIAVFEDDPNHTFRTLLLMAFDIQIKDEPNARAIINSLGDAMYQLLAGWGGLHAKRNAPVESFKNTLLENIPNCDFEISGCMKSTGYCSSYFRKLFKEYTGCSPASYLIRLRIEYSKRQLQQYHDVRPIKEIAASSGFSDPYYFSRVFKRFVGVSPQRYLQNPGSHAGETGTVRREPV